MYLDGYGAKASGDASSAVPAAYYFASCCFLARCPVAARLFKHCFRKCVAHEPLKRREGSIPSGGERHAEGGVRRTTFSLTPCGSFKFTPNEKAKPLATIKSTRPR